MSAPPEVTERTKELVRMVLLSDPTVVSLVAHPDPGVGYTGVYLDQIPPGGPSGVPSLNTIYPATVIKDMSTHIWQVLNGNGLRPIGFEMVLNISACSNSRSAHELIDIVDAVNAALVGMNGTEQSGIKIDSMVLEDPLSAADQNPSGTPRRWLGGLWRGKGSL